DNIRVGVWSNRISAHRETEWRRFRSLGSQHSSLREGITPRGSGVHAGAVPDAACDLRDGVSGGESDGVFSEPSGGSSDRPVSSRSGVDAGHRKYIAPTAK